MIMGDFNTIGFAKDWIGVAETKLDVGSTMLNGVIQYLHLNDAHIVLGLVDPYLTFFFCVWAHQIQN